MASKQTLKGIDVSHWNPDNRIQSDIDFCICKASEGASYGDSSFYSKLDRCKAKGIDLVGAYHYAKTNNLPDTDAVNFLRRIADRPELGNNMLLALDLEGEDIKRPNAYQWARRWLDLVYQETGIRALLYISASYTKNCKEIVEGNYGLWVAHWGVKQPKYSAWNFYTVWQNAVEDNLDRDIFNGTKEQYLKYCRRE